MTEVTLPEIKAMLSQFISGKDRSIRLAGKLEVAIDRLYPENEDWQELVLALASYRPGGGDYLYSEAELVNLCRKMLMRLTNGNP